MKLYTAEYQTMLINAQGYGRSPEEALKALIDRWQGDWAKTTKADKDHLTKNRDDIRLFEIELGKGYVIGSHDMCAYPFMGLGSEARYDRLFDNNPSIEATDVLDVQPRTASRSIQFLNALSPRLLNNTFEGRLLYALIADDNPAQESTETEYFLGSDELFGEGYITFAGDLEALEEFIESAKSTNSVIAKRLLPSLQQGYEIQEADPSTPTQLYLNELKDDNGNDTPVTIFGIIQAMMQQYENAPDEFLVRVGTPANTSDFEIVRITRNDMTLDSDQPTKQPGFK